MAQVFTIISSLCTNQRIPRRLFNRVGITLGKMLNAIEFWLLFRDSFHILKLEHPICSTFSSSISVLGEGDVRESVHFPVALSHTADWYNLPNFGSGFSCKMIHSVAWQVQRTNSKNLWKFRWTSDCWRGQCGRGTACGWSGLSRFTQTIVVWELLAHCKSHVFKLMKSLSCLPLTFVCRNARIHWFHSHTT